MELTKEIFEKVLDQKLNKLVTEQVLNQKLSGMATVQSVQQAVQTSEKRIIARIDDAQEELARMTKDRFDDVLDRLNVRERVEKLEKDMVQMKMALHLS